MAILEAKARDHLRHQSADQPQSHGPRFGAASHVLIGNTLGIVVLMKRQAGGSYRNGWKNEPRLRAADVRGPFRVEGQVRVEVRLHTLQVALDALRGGRRQLDLAEHEKHLPVAVKAASTLRLYDFPEKTAAFRNQQAMIGREHRPGHDRFHRRSSAGGRGTDWSEQAGADFLSFGFGNGRSNRFALRHDLRASPASRLLQYAIEKRPRRPGLRVIGKHLEQTGFQPAHLARRSEGENRRPVHSRSWLARSSERIRLSCGAWPMRTVCAVPRERDVRRGSREPSLSTKASNCARTSRGGVKLPDRMRCEPPARWHAADFGDMPFHYASGRKDHPIVNVDRFDQPSLDRFADALDGDTTFQRHTKRNAGRDRRRRLERCGATGASCAKAATAIVNQTMHPRIIDLLRPRRYTER